jgi:(E)-2-((N-methylformamido)methylene)succinate hydrolase
LRDYAAQFEAECARGGWSPPFDVVGFSMGALVAQRVAVDLPHLVRRLVLVSGVFDRSAAESASVVARVAEVRSGRYHESIEPALERWFTPAFAAAHPDIVDGVRRRMSANTVDSYSDAYEVFATGDAELVGSVSSIAVPTLVITGSGGRYLDGHFTLIRVLISGRNKVSSRAPPAYLLHYEV